MADLLQTPAVETARCVDDATQDTASKDEAIL